MHRSTRCKFRICRAPWKMTGFLHSGFHRNSKKAYRSALSTQLTPMELILCAYTHLNRLTRRMQRLFQNPLNPVSIMLTVTYLSATSTLGEYQTLPCRFRRLGLEDVRCPTLISRLLSR